MLYVSVVGIIVFRASSTRIGGVVSFLFMIVLNFLIIFLVLMLKMKNFVELIFVLFDVSVMV